MPDIYEVVNLAPTVQMLVCQSVLCERIDPVLFGSIFEFYSTRKKRKIYIHFWFTWHLLLKKKEKPQTPKTTNQKQQKKTNKPTIIHLELCLFFFLPFYQTLVNITYLGL